MRGFDSLMPYQFHGDAVALYPVLLCLLGVRVKASGRDVTDGPGPRHFKEVQVVWILLGAVIVLALCGSGLLWYVCTDKIIDINYLEVLRRCAYKATTLPRLRRIERRLMNYVISRHTHRLENHAAEVKAVIHRRRQELILAAPGEHKWDGSE